MTQIFKLQSWLSTLLPLGSTIQQAINSLENSGMQIVLVVAEGNKFLGTLTDGDIRRSFLKGYRLDSVIDDLINKNPLVVPPDYGRDFVLQLMKSNKIRQLPIIDQSSTVIGLHVWDSIVSPIAFKNVMLIMAGGKGTRLYPLTKNCPKPMLDVAGKPILQHILERAVGNGFENFVISLGYLGHIIENYFGDGSKFGVRIEYLKEEVPLGTAGCLSLLGRAPELPLIVTNGDVLADINYKEFLQYHLIHKASATMAVRQHEIQNQFGVVRTNGLEIEAFEEKPIYRSHINAGIYILNPETLMHLKYNEICDMPELFSRIKINSGHTIVYPIYEPWLDVGRSVDLNIARNYHNHQGEA